MFESQRVCPIMTIATRVNQPGSQVKTPCIRTQCAFWIAFKNANEETGSGKCVFYSLAAIEFHTRMATRTRTNPATPAPVDNDQEVPF